LDEHAEPAPLLAAATEEFRQEAQTLLTGARFDRWPSRPRFTVRVHLADPAALFAAQRRQQWLFGGMILSVAGIAGLGGWQANRAFRRQLALSEEKSNFVSSVSHELRAPLASMRLLAEGLAEGRVTEEAKRREYAGFLVQETRRLGSLVENVLDFARIEQGRQRYDFEPTDVGRLVRETVKLLQPRAAELGIGLTCSTDETASGEDHPRSVATAPGRTPRSEVADLKDEIACDGPAIQRALLNLLDNAFKHAPVGSAVKVTLGSIRGPRSAIFISVADSGPGIPAEDHTRIFERFYRRGSELRRETQGVGLGLAIVKHIVEAHGGRVRVASTVGHGATFTLELPAASRGGK
jgi:signal transduction histidine kinase